MRSTAHPYAAFSPGESFQLNFLQIWVEYKTQDLVCQTSNAPNLLTAACRELPAVHRMSQQGRTLWNSVRLLPARPQLPWILKYQNSLARYHCLLDLDFQLFDELGRLGVQPVLMA